MPRHVQLHGRIIEEAGDPVAILSPIPIDFWADCYRITVHTQHKPGSLSKFYDYLGQKQLTVIYVLGSAVSSSGDACVSIIVSPADPDIIAGSSPQERTNSLKSILKPSKFMECLSQSYVFSDRDNKQAFCESFTVAPLTFLRAYASDSPSEYLTRRLGNTSRSFSIHVQKSRVDLQQPEWLVHGKALSVYEVMSTKDNQNSRIAMLVADPHDCHFRVCLLPPRNYFAVSTTFEILSPNRVDLCGVEQRITSAMAEPDLGLNLYYSSSFVIDATASDGAYKEKSKLKVIVESPRGEVGEKAASLQHDLTQKIALALATRPPTIILSKLRVRPLLAPLAFVATNAGLRISDEHLDMAIELCQTLKELNLHPINLGQLGGEFSAPPQMARILDACPILVGFFVPEKALKLQRRQEHVRYTSPVWPVFEEIYHGLQGRPTYRLIHRAVYPPQHMDNVVQMPFANRAEFSAQLGKLYHRIEEDMEKEIWPQLLDKCGKALAKRDIGETEIRNKDVERRLRQIRYPNDEDNL